MSGWAGYFGAGDARLLRQILGANTTIHCGDGFGLGLRSDESAPGRLIVAEDGAATAVIGDVEEAGCAATVTPAGPTLTLQNDPFGLHSVYWAQCGHVLWFASSLRVLRELPGLALQRDLPALHGYLCFSYVPMPATLFCGVSVLPAGCSLRVTPQEMARSRVVTWREDVAAQNEETAVAQLRTLLQAAVARKLGAEREVGVFLSGGLDSSLVAALLAEAGARVHLFTLDFGPPFDAELPSAQQVATHLGRPLHVVPARPAQIQAALEETAAALELPFGDGVTVPLYLLGQAARQEVGTIFNGEGGDQLFGGWANKPMVAAELYGAPDYDREAAYLATFHRFYGLTDSLYTPQMQATVGELDVGAWVRPALNADRFASLLHRLRAANLCLKGAQNIAPRAVQLAAAQGLRVCAPYFDRALTEWTFTLPPEWFLNGACEKYLLKRAAESYLPAEIVWREKRGMGVPVTEWCLGPLRREVARRLSARRLQRAGLFTPSAIEALRRGQDQPGEFRRRRVGEKLWTLFLLHAWEDAHSHCLNI